MMTANGRCMAQYQEKDMLKKVKKFVARLGQIARTLAEPRPTPARIPVPVPVAHRRTRRYN